ncbi:MAG TPA: tRNA pseudouridine(38-40) synthase TruA [bacterium]|nr:tRNA pseudouridine(38-40) synthase TruA [bacterium]
MRNIKLVFSFDGSKFSGWQKQKNKRSVQETLENTLEKITNEKIKVIGCGRTDSKVHSINYVANFKTNSKIPSENLKKAINSFLSPEVYIKKVKDIPLSFHSRYDALRKSYIYLISLSKCPFLNNYALFFEREIDIEKIIEGKEYIIGKHDFSAFKGEGSNNKNPVREIFKIDIKKKRFFLDRDVKLIEIEIEGDGFLYKMVRNIVGTLIYTGIGKIQPSDIKKIIEGKNRKFAGPTACASGLYLKKVVYPKIINSPLSSLKGKNKKINEYKR